MFVDRGILQIPFVLLCVLLLPSTAAKAQSTIAGKVVDAEAEKPLPGVNVFLEGTMRGVATDEGGRFKLKNIKPGAYTLIASMVGYARVEKKITVDAQTPSSASALQLELEPDVIQLTGITVEGDRRTWLRRLDRFRESFFGTAPNSRACTFVNPEVLAFEESGDMLVVRASQPLRVRNDGLGYEVTYHLPRYEVRPDAWVRYGTAEFDTLAADSREQRAAWRRAREETYRGSLYHFLDALQAGVLTEAGFQVRVVTERQVRIRNGDVQILGGEVISKVRRIFTPTSKAGRAFLVVPRAEASGAGLVVQYDPDKQFSTVNEKAPRGGRFPDPMSNQEATLIRILGGNQVLINTETGAFVRPDKSRYVMKGQWGRYMTAATSLPPEHHPERVSP